MRAAQLPKRNINKDPSPKVTPLPSTTLMKIQTLNQSDVIRTLFHYQIHHILYKTFPLHVKSSPLSPITTLIIPSVNETMIFIRNSSYMHNQLVVCAYWKHRKKPL